MLDSLFKRRYPKKDEEEETDGSEKKYGLVEALKRRNADQTSTGTASIDEVLRKKGARGLPSKQQKSDY
jgi:hypothetical protein